MKATAREWIEKAEADFFSAGREYRARKRPNLDAACFFAQQCIEKYLKGRLADAGRPIPKCRCCWTPSYRLSPCGKLPVRGWRH